MSGHSKWASIKHKKAITDARKGKIFTKLIKEISVAARLGGGDIDGNPRLRTAVEKAREANMPNDNIERAIKKGTGELEGSSYEEFTYEGYGPDGVAMMIEIMTDNKNRTAAEIRKIMSKYGGSLGESGCVSWMFKKKGVINIPKSNYKEDEIIEIALDAGALDVDVEEDLFVVYTEPESLESVRKTFEGKNIKVSSASLEKIPDTTVKLSEEKAKKVITLLEALEDNDDVQNVVANFEIE